MTRTWILVVLLALALPSVMRVDGQTTALTYQGSLKDGGTTASGSFQMQFKLFDSLGGAGQIGSTITDVPVTVSAGIFSVKLDFGSNALSGANRWLEIAVRHNSGEGYTTLNPREQLTSSPYSVRTLSAASADGLSASCIGCVQDSNINSLSGAKVTGMVANATNATNATTATNATQLNGQASSFYQNATNLSSGTLDALRLPVPLTLSGTSGTHIIRGQNASTANGASGVYGLSIGATGTNYGVYGQSAGTSGRGVFADATSTTGINYGVYGRTASTSGKGVYGEATSTSGITIGVYGRNVSSSTLSIGVYGEMPSTTGQTTGVYGESASSSGTGVVGSATSTTGTNYGVYGQTASSSGRGVFADATSTTGTNFGVYGRSAGTIGRGVYGEATNSCFGCSNIGVEGRSVGSNLGNIGVYGDVPSTTGQTTGVYGESSSSSGTGVTGSATSTTGTNYGVYGQTASSSGRGVFADATSTTGNAFGVYGRSAASMGRGVYGEATSSGFGTSSIGVYGRSLSSSLGGIGVLGDMPSTTGQTTGVYGESSSSSGTGVSGAATSTTGTSYGVHGTVSSPQGYAGYFSGGRNYFSGHVGIGSLAPTAPLTVISTDNTASDNTATFQNTAIGPNLSHIHYGVQGSWFIRSAAASGTVVIQDTGGNVGIGTVSPNSKLQVTGGSIYISSPNSLIITSPNGACWFITVGNTGVLSSISVTCP